MESPCYADAKSDSFLDLTCQNVGQKLEKSFKIDKIPGHRKKIMKNLRIATKFKYA